MANVLNSIRANGAIKLGSVGSTVRLAQLALITVGYKLTGTSFFGGATDVATRSFQKQYGLTVDGVIGERTALALDQAAANVRSDDPATKGKVLEANALPLWVHYGLTYLNLKEGSGASDNPVILEWAKEEGGNIAKDYAHDSVAWCALFANMVLTKCNLKGTETLWALDFNSDTKWPNTPLNGPAVGAFMPMKRTGGGHITICVGKAMIEGKLYLMGLGGNQGDAVSIAAFPVDRPESYRWPLGTALPTNGEIGLSNLPIINSNGVISSKES
jgi:uncharacterized protein (TIGR02594 family)